MEEKFENVFNAISEQKAIERYTNTLVIATEKLRLDLVKTINESHVPMMTKALIVREVLAKVEDLAKEEVTKALSERQGELKRQLNDTEEKTKELERR